MAPPSSVKSAPVAPVKAERLNCSGPARCAPVVSRCPAGGATDAAVAGSAAVVGRAAAWARSAARRCLTAGVVRSPVGSVRRQVARKARSRSCLSLFPGRRMFWHER